MPISSIPRLVAFLLLLWSFLTNVWSETGCRMDPSGRCVTQGDTAPTVTKLDEGCMMDPSGSCKGDY